jgi:hypothetical protein
MSCEHDWIAVASAITFAIGTLVALACAQCQEEVVKATLAVQEDEIKNLSLRLDKIHTQYHEDLLTILRETLRPASQRSSIAGDSSDERGVILDNNSIPAGPSE